MDKNAEKNTIYLAHGYSPDEVYKKDFKVEAINWISKNPFKNGVSSLHFKVKIRHGATMYDAKVNFCSSKRASVNQKMNKNFVQVELAEVAHGVSPGQFAVFYQNNVCLGGGMIV